MFNCTKAISVGKHEVGTNKYILVQMNKKCSIELKFKMSPFFTLNLISTNEQKKFNRTKI